MTSPEKDSEESAARHSGSSPSGLCRIQPALPRQPRAVSAPILSSVNFAQRHHACNVIRRRDTLACNRTCSFELQVEHIRDVDLFNARRGRRLGRFLHCILQTLSSASGLDKHNTNIRYDEVFSNWLTRFTRGIDHHWVSTVRGLGKWSTRRRRRWGHGTGWHATGWWVRDGYR